METIEISFSLNPACVLVCLQTDQEHEPNHAPKISGAGRRHGGSRFPAQPGAFTKRPGFLPQVQCSLLDVR